MILLILLTSALFYFRVKEIGVEGTKELSGLSVYSHASLFFLNPVEIERELTDRNPSVREINVDVQYPHTLSIKVIEAIPLAQVKLEDGYMGITSDGKILNKQKDPLEEGVLTIMYYQPLYFNNFTVGETVDIVEIVQTAGIIEETQKLDVAISKVDIRNENMIVLFSEDREILVSATKDSRLQVAQLKVVLEQVRAKALGFKRLDLRFEKPIIVFTN